jgi:hypothetical protein
MQAGTSVQKVTDQAGLIEIRCRLDRLDLLDRLVLK